MGAKANAKIISISVPNEMSQDVHQIAKEERRSVSEVWREAMRQYAALKDLEDVRERARKSAKKKGIKPSDVQRVVDEERQLRSKKKR